MHLSSASSRGGGGPRADVGEYWDFATNFSPCGGGKCGDFASVQPRGDWERSIVRSIDDGKTVRIGLKQNLGNSGREERLKFSPDCEQLM